MVIAASVKKEDLSCVGGRTVFKVGEGKLEMILRLTESRIRLCVRWTFFIFLMMKKRIIKWNEDRQHAHVVGLKVQMYLFFTLTRVCSVQCIVNLTIFK